MKATILPISEGSDIIRCIVDFANSNQKSVTVMSAFGLVRDVRLSLPEMYFPGVFHMLSLNGAVNASGYSFGDLTITLAGEQGQLFAGTVDGKVIAASDMLVAVATMFDRPTVCSVWPNGVIQEQEVEEEEEDDEDEDEDEDEEEDEEEDEDEDEDEELSDNE